MKRATFISVGENIHCTRVYKVGGPLVQDFGNGRWHILFTDGNTQKALPVPEPMRQNADWQAGKVKHCAVAMWQGQYGRGEERERGIAYLRAAARRQVDHGAVYLDVNVDEFGADVEERVRTMRWVVNLLQQTVSVPLSIDSSNLEILRTGLEACDPARGRPLVNSVSLERVAAVELAAHHRAAVIASAAGETGLPSSVSDRLANLEKIMARLMTAGFAPCDIHLDPLVLPVSVDSHNGRIFLEAVSAARQQFGKDVHIVAGLSNVSFGMPNRKLINQVFTYLAVGAGADGGIVDPLQINRHVLDTLDPTSEPFRLAQALLMGEDEFGLNFIAACREGRLG